MCNSRWLKLLYLPTISEGKYFFIFDFVSCYSVIFMQPAYSYSVSVRARSGVGGYSQCWVNAIFTLS